jgi:hypothetical protein
MKAQPSQTLRILQRFNQAFQQHDPSLLEDLIAEDCVMESVEPAPDGTRYDGAFTDEHITASDEHGIIRWRYRFGPGLSNSVRGVNVMRVRDGQIVEALGYVKTGDAPVATAVRSAVE